MRWLEKIRMRLVLLLHRGREVQRLDAELSFHLEQQIAENISAGMSPVEARYAARRAFGNPTLLREQARENWSWNSVEMVLQNIRIGIRTLARTPGFAFLSILVIAIGIGANVALFTVVRSVLLKPLPFKDPTRLIRLYEYSSDDKFPFNVVAGGIFGEWKKLSHSFSDLAILSGDEGEYNMSGANGQLPERVRAVECSWDLFPTLGVEPALGRTIRECDGCFELGIVEKAFRKRSHDLEPDNTPQCEALYSNWRHAAMVCLPRTDSSVVDAALS